VLGWVLADGGEEAAPSPEATTAPGEATAPGATSAPARELLGASCESALYGFRISYPVGWFASEGDPELACRFFHPDPFEVPPATEFSGLIAVGILPAQGPFDELLAGWTDPLFATVLSRRDVTIDERPAVEIETEATGEGLDAAGTKTFAYLVDLNGEGFVLTTAGFSGAAYARYRAAVEAMASSLVFPELPQPIVVGEGIAGVRLGMSEDDVRGVLGEPGEVIEDFTELGPYVELRYAGLSVFLTDGGVTSIGTTRAEDRTPEDVGVGSSLEEVEAAVPGVLCQGTGICTVGEQRTGERVTDFLLEGGKVTQVWVYIWREGG
jgi:hypothetical protein